MERKGKRRGILKKRGKKEHKEEKLATEREKKITSWECESYLL